MGYINPRKPQAKINVEPGAKGYVGCSAIAAVLGVSEFKDNTPMVAYHRFIGEAPELTQEQKEVFDRGHRWEEYIAQEISALHGIKLKKVSTAYVHPLNPHIICHPDRLMVGKVDGKRVGVEIKSSSYHMNRKWGEEGTDEVPSDYFFQCLGYMACGVCDEVWLFRMSDFKLTKYVITYDEGKIARLEASLIPIVESFVRGEEPGPSQWSEITEKFSDPNGDMVADESIMTLCEEYEKAAEDKKAAETRQKEIRDSIVSRMNGKSRLVSPTGRRIHSYTCSERTGFDKDKFQEENPELYEKYITKTTVYSFR